MADSRIKCFHCNRPLSLYKGFRPIYVEYKDPAGNVHKLHKHCFKDHYSEEALTAKARDEK